MRQYSSAHPNAVSSLSNGNSYGYDANGNMTSRSVVVNGTPYAATLVYDAENRLTSVNGNTPPTSTPGPIPTSVIPTATATLVPTNTPTPTATASNTPSPTPTFTPTPIFADVTSGPYKPYIETLYRAGMVSGCSTNPLKYCPYDNVTRAQMAVFTLKAEHGASYSPPSGSTQRFTDVPPTYWAYAWINQLAAEGITSGYGGGNYCPDTAVTRETAPIFLLRGRYGGSYGPPSYGSYTYNDISGSIYKNWIQDLVTHGATDYCTTGNYCPTANLTRERVAYFLVTIFNIVAYQPQMADQPALQIQGGQPSIQDVVYHTSFSLPSNTVQTPLQNSVMASFAYDGDGNRVSATINGVTTYYIGNYYEQTGSTITKYYYAGSQRVAMRTGSTLYYLLSDQLGSTSLTLDSNGTVISELRYTAWGQVRYQAGTVTPEYTYTGQLSYMASTGLMYYNARWYDPALGRMAQADTVVPPGVQGYDRYAYVSNSPVNFTDPSGHCVDDFYWDGGCHTESAWLDHYLGLNGVKTNGLSKADKWNVAIAVGYVGSKLATTIGNNTTPEDAFKKVMGSVSIEIGGANALGEGCQTSDGSIACADIREMQTIIHELGHEFDIQYQKVNGYYPSGDVIQKWVGITDPSKSGFMCVTYPCQEHPGTDTSLPKPDNFEQFADMFLNWILEGNPAYSKTNGFQNTGLGVTWSQWMNSTAAPYYTDVGMPYWLSQLGH